jgi:hypothetical protein
MAMATAFRRHREILEAPLAELMAAPVAHVVADLTRGSRDG